MYDDNGKIEIRQGKAVCTGTVAQYACTSLPVQFCKDVAD